MRPASLDRRAFLKSGLVAGSAAALGSQAFLRPLFAASGATPKNLVLVELVGGNDGFNTIVPFGVNGGAYATTFRKSIGIAEAKVLKVPGQPVGFHPALSALKAQFDAGRVAIVQGTHYPGANFSHEISRRYWHSGTPGVLSTEGWLGRYLALFPEPPSPAVVEISNRLTLLTEGTPGFVPAVPSLDDFAFPFDPYLPEDAANRKAAFLAIAGGASGDPVLGPVAKTSSALVELTESFANVPAFPYADSYPDHSFGDALKLCVRLLAAGIGLRVFHVGVTGFDTHADQNVGGYHAALLGVVSDGLAALQTDLLSAGLASDTLVVVFSEFGRTIHENGSGGTDHGSVNPMIVLGEPVVGHGGFVTPHPSLDPGTFTSESEPAMVADFRDVFGTVLKRFFGASTAQLETVFPGHLVEDLAFLA